MILQLLPTWIGTIRNINEPMPERIDRVPYGRFRNVYLYITEACQLRCGHCYMGARLERAVKMPLPQIQSTLETWRRLGGSKLTILGGEPTIHPDYVAAIRMAGAMGYEHVITTTNGQEQSARRLRQLDPGDFAYVQISLDGGSAATNDNVRGPGTFDTAIATARELTARGFDTLGGREASTTSNSAGPGSYAATYRRAPSRAAGACLQVLCTTTHGR